MTNPTLMFIGERESPMEELIINEKLANSAIAHLVVSEKIEMYFYQKF